MTDLVSHTKAKIGSSETNFGPARVEKPAKIRPRLGD